MKRGHQQIDRRTDIATTSPEGRVGEKRVGPKFSENLSSTVKLKEIRKTSLWFSLLLKMSVIYLFFQLVDLWQLAIWNHKGHTFSHQQLPRGFPKIQKRNGFHELNAEKRQSRDLFCYKKNSEIILIVKFNPYLGKSLCKINGFDMFTFFWGHKIIIERKSYKLLVISCVQC